MTPEQQATWSELVKEVKQCQGCEENSAILAADAELEALRAQIAQLEQELDDFESGYKSQARRNCALHDEIKELRAQVARLMEALTTLTTLYNKAHSERWNNVAELDAVHDAWNNCRAALSPTQSAREWLEQKMAEAVQAERERCAKVAETTKVIHGDHYGSYNAPSIDGMAIATAIREGR